MTSLNTVSETTKKFYFLLPIALVLVVLAAWLYFHITKQGGSSQRQAFAQLLPGIAKSFNVSSSVNLNIQTKEMNTYKLTPIDFRNNAQETAQKLGFKTTSVNISDSLKGEGHFYKDGEKFLAIYANTIAYVDNSPQRVAENLSTDRLTKIASDFIISMLKTEVPIDHEPHHFITYEDKTNDQIPKKYTYFFQYKLGNYPITPPTVSVQVGANGNILAFNIEGIAAEENPGKKSLLSEEKALSQLKANQATLVYVEDKEEGSVLATNIGSVNINNVYLGYYYSSKENSLAPAWIFEGESVINKTSSREIFALPALSNPQP